MAGKINKIIKEIWQNQQNNHSTHKKKIHDQQVLGWMTSEFTILWIECSQQPTIIEQSKASQQPTIIEQKSHTGKESKCIEILFQEKCYSHNKGCHKNQIYNE